VSNFAHTVCVYSCGMTQRLGLALATLAAGAGLLTAALASAAPPSPAILRVGGTGNLDSPVYRWSFTALRLK
jgi:hypothetical protein